MFQFRTIEGGRVEPGRSLSHQFEIEARLGNGGLGDLHRVRVLGSQDRLALRITDIGDTADVLDAIADVIALHEKFAHLPIVRIRLCGGDQGRTWYAMDYSEGESLLARARRAPIETVEAVRLVAEAAGTLARLHEQNVIHQDLSARNLFVERGQVKLLELGIIPVLARLVQEKPGLLATPRARAPEQLIVAEPDPRTDLYALAAVLYFLLTGRKAVPAGHNVLQLAVRQRLRPPPLDEVPAGLRATLQRALALRPEHRFRSAREFREALLVAARAV